MKGCRHKTVINWIVINCSSDCGLTCASTICRTSSRSAYAIRTRSRSSSPRSRRRRSRSATADKPLYIESAAFAPIASHLLISQRANEKVFGNVCPHFEYLFVIYSLHCVCACCFSCPRFRQVVFANKY